jgi:hypothetical protein
MRIQNILKSLGQKKVSSEIGNRIGFFTHKVDTARLQSDDESIGYCGLGRSNVKLGDKMIGALCWLFLDIGRRRCYDHGV